MYEDTSDSSLAAIGDSGGNDDDNGIPVIYFQVIGLVGSIMLTWILILVAAVYFRWCKPAPVESDAEQGDDNIDTLTKKGKIFRGTLYM